METGVARAKQTTEAEVGLYERDFHRWIEQQAALLRSGRSDQLDVANLLEEIEDMGRSEKRAVESNLTVVLSHLLKYQFQADQRSNSWRGSIVDHRRRLRRLLQESPSLMGYAAAAFAEAHWDAREQARAETGLPIERLPEASPYTLEQALDPQFLPE